MSQTARENPSGKDPENGDRKTSDSSFYEPSEDQNNKRGPETGQNHERHEEEPEEKEEGKKEKKKAGKRRKRRIPRWVYWVALTVIVIIALAVGIPFLMYHLSHVSTDDAFVEAHISPVSGRVAGYVWKIYVRDNELVKEGQLLLELDPRNYEVSAMQADAALKVSSASNKSAQIEVSLTRVTAYAALDEASAAVTYAQSAVQTAQARLAASQSTLEEARAAVLVAQRTQEQADAQANAAQAVADRDQTDLMRSRKLYDSNSITPQQMDHAVAAADISQADFVAACKTADVEAARVVQAKAAEKNAENLVAQSQSEQAQARLKAAQTAPQQVKYRQSQQNLTAAQVAQSAAVLKQAQLDVSYTKIYAPVSGRVTHKSAEPGAYFVPGQTLLSIVPENIYVIANYKETDLTHMHPGQPVKMSIDAFPDHTFEGRVDSIQAGSGATFSLLPPENATGNYIKVVQRVPVKIVFTEPPDQSKYYIVPGMSVVPVVDISYRPTKNVTETELPHQAWRQALPITAAEPNEPMMPDGKTAKKKRTAP